MLAIAIHKPPRALPTAIPKRPKRDAPSTSVYNIKLKLAARWASRHQHNTDSNSMWKVKVARVLLHWLVVRKLI